MKRVKFNNRVEEGSPLHELGWTNQDFWEIKAEMAQCRLQHNIPLPLQLMRDYCSIPDRIKYNLPE